MMRLLLASAVMMGGALVAQPAMADHGFYGGRACYRPPVHHHHRRSAHYAPYRGVHRGYGGYGGYGYNVYSPYAAHARYRQYHYGYGGYPTRGGVSLYGPRGGFSIRF